MDQIWRMPCSTTQFNKIIGIQGGGHADASFGLLRSIAVDLLGLGGEVYRGGEGDYFIFRGVLKIPILDVGRGPRNEVGLSVVAVSFLSFLCADMEERFIPFVFSPYLCEQKHQVMGAI